MLSGFINNQTGEDLEERPLGGIRTSLHQG